MINQPPSPGSQINVIDRRDILERAMQYIREDPRYMHLSCAPSDPVEAGRYGARRAILTEWYREKRKGGR